MEHIYAFTIVFCKMIIILYSFNWFAFKTGKKSFLLRGRNWIFWYNLH